MIFLCENVICIVFYVDVGVSVFWIFIKIYHHINLYPEPCAMILRPGQA